jgi:pimeloyl-ACP methyl ester carboxylesterase
VHGNGRPVVLLHGAFAGASSWSAQTPALVQAPVVFAKTLRMLATEPQLDLASLAAVTVPTLVLQGDRDEVTLEHGAAVATALPGGGSRCSPAPTSRPPRTPRS